MSQSLGQLVGQLGRNFLLKPILQGVITSGLGIGLASTATLYLVAVGVSPPPALAYTARVSIFLTRDANESYVGLVRRAEITARAAVQRSFDVDLLATESIVTIVGENQGVSVPILTVAVTRQQWRTRPDVNYWTRYYDTAAGLLGM